MTASISTARSALSRQMRAMQGMTAPHWQIAPFSIQVSGRKNPDAGQEKLVTGNRRNGTANKRLKGQDGEVPIAVPRDRDGSFEPELVK
jgi:hypothetical protein